MKIDKTNPAHWLYLAMFGANVVLAMVLRAFMRRPTKPRVVLYGHRLCGNLLAIHDYLRAHCVDDFDVVFMTMDPAYFRELRSAGVSSVLAIAPACITLLARADAVISDHGLHAMQWLPGRTSLKFFDVWHGIPFKGFDADDFRLQHRYDEVWVASPLMRKMYVERYGFDADKVKVTGYARTDRLVRQDEDVVAIKRRLGLDGPDVGKVVLFAPTWKQDAHQRSIYPFGTDEQAFLRSLSELARCAGCTIVMRTHLNSGTAASGTWERIVQRPFADYPDTEALLLASDILVCDWSSIAFERLLLERPTLFLDVEAPFAKGFSLDASHRYGEIVGSMHALLTSLQRYLGEPQAYQLDYGEKQAAICVGVYGGYADGKASERCVARLRMATTDESSR